MFEYEVWWKVVYLYSIGDSSESTFGYVQLHPESVEEEGAMAESDGDDSTVTCGDILASIPRPLEVVNDDHEDTDSTVASPKSNRTVSDIL